MYIYFQVSRTKSALAPSCYIIPPVQFAFLDESGDPAPESSSRFLIVAALVTAHPRKLVLTVRRVRRALGKRSPMNELKARFTTPKVIERFLKTLAAEDVSLYVVVVNKPEYRLAEGEALYRAVVARVVRQCVERHPHLRLILDKRYTNARQRVELETAIREAIADVPNQVVVIEALDSTSRPELQAVDFVAWAFGQKYERGDPRFAHLLAERVVVEEVLD